MMGHHMSFRKILNSLAIAALSTSLGACGGGGGGSVASTPAGPPRPTYTKIPDLAGNQTFQTASSGFRYAAPGGASVPPTSFSPAPLGSGPTIAFNAATGDYTLAINGFSETYTSADLDRTNTDPKVQRFVRLGANGEFVSRFSLNTPSPNGVDLSYTRTGEWNSRADTAVGGRSYFAVGGVPTIASDMPRTGTATYGATRVSGIAFLRNPAFNGGNEFPHTLDGSSANFSADFADGSVRSQLVLSGRPAVSGQQLPPIFIGNFVGNGRIISGSNAFSGTLSPVGGSTLTGSFQGAFFGPQAAEYGLAFSLGGTFNGGAFTADGTQAGALAPNTQLLP
jgi:hypothetical protein